MRILKDYERVSRQRINFMKSSIQFGYKVPEAIQVEVQQLPWTTTIMGMRNYLGIVESLGGSKTQFFLTRRGKEVIIKSVV